MRLLWMLPFFFKLIFSQTNECIHVVYEAKSILTPLKSNLDRAYRDEITLANKSIFKYRLVANNKESVFQIQEKIDNSQKKSSIQVFPSVSEKTIVNFKLKNVFYEIDFFGREYSLKDSVLNCNLKKTSKTLNILNHKTVAYRCRKDSSTYTLFISPKLKSNFLGAPNNYFTDKGLVLKSIHNIYGKTENQKIIFEAKSISNCDNNSINYNLKEVISVEDFKRKQKEFQNKMREYDSEIDTKT